MRRSVGLGVALGSGIERAEDRELEQRGIVGNRRLDRLERDRLHLRAELRAVLAERGLEPLLLRFQTP